MDSVSEDRREHLLDRLVESPFSRTGRMIDNRIKELCLLSGGCGERKRRRLKEKGEELSSAFSFF
jgi:hypothetical protein